MGELDGELVDLWADVRRSLARRNRFPSTSTTSLRAVLF